MPHPSARIEKPINLKNSMPLDAFGCLWFPSLPYTVKSWLWAFPSHLNKITWRTWLDTWIENTTRNQLNAFRSSLVLNQYVFIWRCREKWLLPYSVFTILNFTCKLKITTASMCDFSWLFRVSQFSRLDVNLQEITAAGHMSHSSFFCVDFSLPHPHTSKKNCWEEIPEMTFASRKFKFQHAWSSLMCFFFSLLAGFSSKALSNIPWRNEL